MRQSAISTYLNCPYKYKLQYIDSLKTIFDQQADNALVIGKALHYGCETGSIEKMLDYYYDQFNVITDLQINEAIKLEIMLPKILKLLEPLHVEAHEFEFEDGGFHGTVDLITTNDDGSIDLYDFKYSNNIEHYLESPQLHIYKYFLEKFTYNVNRLGFIFIPKTQIRQRNNEDLYRFRKRLIETLSTMEPKIIYVDYDIKKVISSLQTAIEMEQQKEFPKNPNRLCDWCNLKQYCMEGIDYMILPENKRREVKVNTNPDMWLYGDSYSGKTVFTDSFDDLLIVNTDGNVDHISSPVVRIKDEITVEGRLTKRKFAWQVFCELVDELEKKQNTFKRVSLDLVEDLYEHCRLFMYDKLGIEHEQDAGYGKGWDMVRTEFCSKIKRLKNCGYQIIYVSKLLAGEVTKKNGEKITTFHPNIPDKVANVLTGTVDLTARVIADGDERYLSFKTSPYIFGGSRYKFGVEEIPLNKDIFIETMKNAQLKEEDKNDRREPKTELSEELKAEVAEMVAAATEILEVPDPQTQSEPAGKTIPPKKRRVRKSKES